MVFSGVVNSNAFSQSEGNSPKTWQTINDLTSRRTNNTTVKELKLNGSIISNSNSNSKTLGDRAFLAAAPKLWNGLPSQIRNESNFHRFKGLLKSHFF